MIDIHRSVSNIEQRLDLPEQRIPNDLIRWLSFLNYPHMASNIKTKVNTADVAEFIRATAGSQQRIDDSFALVELMKKTTGFEPKMWGPSIIGFGVYHYKSDRSKQEGDWPMVGFSPRKAAISLYVYTGCKEHEHLLEGLGKFTMGKACIYIKKLSDINEDALVKMMQTSIAFLKEKYGAACRAI